MSAEPVIALVKPKTASSPGALRVLSQSRPDPAFHYNQTSVTMRGVIRGVRLISAGPFSEPLMRAQAGLRGSLKSPTLL